MMPENHQSNLMPYNRKPLQILIENHHCNLMVYNRKHYDSKPSFISDAL